jgi:DNA ligase-1
MNLKIGEIMQCTLAHKYAGQDVTGWWMSEKFDGVRAIWDGENFLSRTGKILHAPDWFKEGLPKDIMLDGELFCGRGKFQQTVGIVRSHAGNSDWSSVVYKIFDIVVAMIPVEERQNMLGCLPIRNHINFVEQTKCLGLQHLYKFESEVLNKGGEGVMLKAPGSYYEHKRTKNLLKMKRMKHSTARVTGYTEGKGKHTGRIGALECMWDAYTRWVEITVGSGLTDADRENPPQIGAIIKFKYYDITEAGKPRFPIYEGKV